MPLPHGPNHKFRLVQTVQEAVVDYLRDLIVTGQLVPGERLLQDEIADHLNVSRTPVREALHILASQGLVSFSSYKGASVADFSPSQMQEIYAVRTALESYASYLAAQRITEEELSELETLLKEIDQTFQQKDFTRLLEVHHDFHLRICSAAKQNNLFRLAVQHLELTDLYQRMALSLGRGATDPVVEHSEILTALRRRDPEGVASLIRSHLQKTVAELLELFRLNGDPQHV